MIIRKMSEIKKKNSQKQQRQSLMMEPRNVIDTDRKQAWRRKENYTAQ